MIKKHLAVAVLAAISSLTIEANAGSFADMVGTHNETSWTANVRSPTNVSEVINPAKSYDENLVDFKINHQAASAYSTAVLQVFGGKDVTKVGQFLSAVKADGGLGYREHMKDKAALTTDMPNVVWQIGNEINNAVLSASIHTWLGDGKAGGSNDLSIIPTYAEMWFAPAAAGLGSKIMLGSVANAASANAQTFLNTLLDYTIIGTYAPSLAGKKVSEIINYGSIHYSQGATNWTTPVDLFRKRGILVWHTEEVGGGGAEKGYGSVLAVKAVARTLTEAGNKVFLWGCGIGTNSCNQWMPLLASYLGTEQLTTITAPVSGTGLETYAFDVGTTGKRVAFVLAGTLTGVTGSGTVYVFRKTGVEQYAAAAMPSISLDPFSVVYMELN